MLAPAQLDNTPFPLQGFRLTLKCGIAVMLLFCIASFVALAQQPARVEALSAATDTAFTIILIGIYVLLGRLQIEVAALILARIILALLPDQSAAVSGCIDPRDQSANAGGYSGAGVY